MKLRKSRLTLAVGAILGAAALIPATSFGWSVDTNAGTLASASAGDTLLFPIYTTVNPANTSFSVTNTSNQTIAAKIRFREQEKSMDVLDFIVIFSPYDKFDFSVAQAPDAPRPTMSWNDSSCLVGPPAGGSVEFPAPSQFVSGDATMSAGHLEVLGMADLTNAYVLGNGSALDSTGVPVTSTTVGAISLAAAAKHGADGKPANCGILVTTLASQSNVWNLNLSGSLLDVGNVLMGRYVITGSGIGIEAGGDAIGIRDSNLGYPTMMISAQSNSECGRNGTANCTQFYAWDGREWDHPHLGEMQTLAGFQAALTAANVSGDWSNNPANFVGLDWVLSFPNKYAYLDLVTPTSPNPLCGGTAPVASPTWCLLDVTNTGYGLPQVWTPTRTTDLCLVDAGLEVWDREEQMATGNVSVSPGNRATLDICQELQVFTLAAVGTEVRPSVIQTAERRGVVTFQNLDAIRGWARLSMPWNIVGDSIGGVLFTTRNTDDPTINNASLTELQKDAGGVANGTAGQ